MFKDGFSTGTLHGLFDLDFLIPSDLMGIELWNFYTYVLVFWDLQARKQVKKDQQKTNVRRIKHYIFCYFCSDIHKY